MDKKLIEKNEYKLIGILNVLFLGDRAEGTARPSAVGPAVSGGHTRWRSGGGVHGYEHGVSQHDTAVHDG